MRCQDFSFYFIPDLSLYCESTLQRAGRHPAKRLSTHGRHMRHVVADASPPMLLLRSHLESTPTTKALPFLGVMHLLGS